MMISHRFNETRQYHWYIFYFLFIKDLCFFRADDGGDDGGDENGLVFALSLTMMMMMIMMPGGEGRGTATRGCAAVRAAVDP